MEEPTPPNLISVWASLNLSGLRRGESAFVDSSDPEIAKLIEDEILVPHESPEPESERVDEQLDVTFIDSTDAVLIPDGVESETDNGEPQAAAP